VSAEDRRDEDYWLRLLPDLIAESEGRGMPIIVDDPGTEHGRALLKSIGVKLREPGEGAA